MRLLEVTTSDGRIGKDVSVKTSGKFYQRLCICIVRASTMAVCTPATSYSRMANLKLLISDTPRTIRCQARKSMIYKASEEFSQAWSADLPSQEMHMTSYKIFALARLRRL